MRISVFTPACSSVYLSDCYHSLLAQSWQDWEWILLPNGPLTECRGAWSRDGRVRVLAWQPGGNIGRLKRLACAAARGRWLVELDHDDLLAPQCLALVAATDQEFAYSDAGLFGPSVVPYRADLGWRHYRQSIYGREVVSHMSFPVTARSLCEIFYAPDHVRAWRRDFYERIGGHASLPLADDLDLMCRTYLAGGQFHHLGGCHYLYRIHGANSWLAQNPRLQRWQARVGRRWRPALVREWCRREGLAVDRGSQCGWIRCRVRRWADAVAASRSRFQDLAPGGWLTLRADGGEPRIEEFRELGYQVVDQSPARLWLWKWYEGGPGERPRFPG